MNAAHAAGLTERIQGMLSNLASWAPDSPLGAVVCTPDAFAGLTAEERMRAFEVLQSATREGGVHLVGTIIRGQRGVSVTELRRQYKGWTISVEADSGSSTNFLAKKIAS
jgi:hypothetical protein